MSTEGDPSASQEPALTEVGRYRSHRRAAEHGLVILSMRLPYWMFQEEGEYLLCVDPAHAERVHEQIERYESDNRFWPPRRQAPSVIRPHSGASQLVFLYAVLMVAFFVAQLQWPERLESLGIADAVKIIGNSETWRAITALTLHSDVLHLAGNVCFGIGFLFLAGQIFGPGLAALGLLTSGFLGNWLTAWAYFPEVHRALGASTAVFGVLGMLIGHGVLESLQGDVRGALKRIIVPLGGGFLLVGFLGAGEGNVDHAAHGFGVLSGMLLGILWSHRRIGKRLQQLCGGLALLLLMVAWAFAQ